MGLEKEKTFSSSHINISAFIAAGVRSFAMDARLRCNLILRAVVLYSTIYSSRPRRWATTSCSRAARRAQRAERGPTAASPEDGGTVKSRHCSYRSVCFVVYGNPMDDGGRRPVIRNDSLPCLGKSLTNPYALPPLPPFDPATAPVTAPRKHLLQLAAYKWRPGA